MSNHLSPFDLGVFDGASHVAVMQAFFDASEIGGFLSVGGYLFRKKHIKPFEKKWARMLRRYSIEFFHMTDCNAGRGQFSDMTKQQREDCQKEAVEAICEHATLGMINSVKIEDYDRIMGPDSYMHNPFSLCVHGAMMMCKNWAETCDPKARIFYVFEAGDKYQGDAQNILSAISEDSRRRKFFNYEDHAFLTKRGSKPTQAADILAWHAAKQYDRSERGITRHRADLDALLNGVRTVKFLNDAKEMEELQRISEKHIPYPHGDKIAGLGMRMNKGNQKKILREISGLITPEALQHILRVR